MSETGDRILHYMRIEMKIKILGAPPVPYDILYSGYGMDFPWRWPPRDQAHWDQYHDTQSNFDSVAKSPSGTFCSSECFKWVKVTGGFFISC